MNTRLPTCIAMTLIVATVSAPLTSGQETGTLEGFVRMRGTRSPVPNARVQFVSIAAMAISDENGHYALTSIPPGVYTLLVEAPGYQPNIVSGQAVRAGQVTVLELELRARSLPLDPIQVEERLDRDRQASTNVSVFRSEQLPPDGDVVHALQGRLPGFDLTFDPGQSRSPGRGEGRVTGPNGRPVLWVLDGVTVEGSLGVRVNSGDVACIEVRRGSRSALEFLRGVGSRSSGVYGAVLLVWTKGKERRMTGACAAPTR